MEKVKTKSLVTLKKKRKVTMAAYAHTGSHGKIFMFCGGNIAKNYPSLLHIYLHKVTEDLIPITITYEI